MPQDFKSSLNERINELREEFDCEYQIALNITVQPTNVIQYLPQQSNVKKVLLNMLLDSFVESKNEEQILDSTKLLSQRIEHFIKFSKLKKVSETTTSSALKYRDLLLSQKRTHKTNKSYLAAAYQFFK
ncbi:MAG TPA: hypothetical protein DIS98_12560 [Colwellia sp.]|nr:hypothetical protein [Colwellia sp.]|tara:strand:+ start:269 stop:655 length:387 start_codon:yes stop_codon:yes gene_type:complete